MKRVKEEEAAHSRRAKDAVCRVLLHLRRAPLSCTTERRTVVVALPQARRRASDGQSGAVAARKQVCTRGVVDALPFTASCV
jgi:hypothetical protein